MENHKEKLAIFDHYTYEDGFKDWADLYRELNNKESQ